MLGNKNTIHTFCFIFFLALAVWSNACNAQLDNAIFSGRPYTNKESKVSPDINESKQGFGFLQYTKDNEYLQKINPGQTFFGSRIWYQISIKIVAEDADNPNVPTPNALGLGNHPSITEPQKSIAGDMDSITSLKYTPLPQRVSMGIRLGGLVQYEFGGWESKPVFRPIINFYWNKGGRSFIAGNIHSQTQHLLPDLLINYDLALKTPIEYGLQFTRETPHLSSENWLEWRQRMDISSGRQEIISFGNRIEFRVLKPNSAKRNMHFKGFVLLMHKGGEGFVKQQAIGNRFVWGGGIKITENKNVFFEGLYFFHQDFSAKDIIADSGQKNVSFKTGSAILLNFGIRLAKNQQLVLSSVTANRFSTPLGAPIYQCVNYENPSYYAINRQLFTARYTLAKNLFSEKMRMEFRIEPSYDFYKKWFLFSVGLYFRYLEGNAAL
ncbi:MAG: hypothetical protein EXR17_01275 [Flavobacteriaceae bacterium]|nr:hypothetical protein [Flavobacteriaceae bacterium]